MHSSSKRDVPIDSLASLLEAEYCGAAAWGGRGKLGAAVEHSSAIVAAYARADELAKLTAAGKSCALS